MLYLSNLKNYKKNKITSLFHVSQQVKVYSTNTNESNDIKYDKKRILEIIKSIKDTCNFKTAFTHKSVRLTNTDNNSYERLEYLGDSLIEYYTTKLLFTSFPNYSEGDLTQLRSLIVERKNLAKISKQIELDMYLKLGVNVEKSTKIFADIYESFTSAIYLEKGEEILHEFLSLTLFNRAEIKDLLKNYKLNKHLSIISEPYNCSLPLEINMNKENISSIREITLKFPEDDSNKNKLLIASEEQRDLSKNIYNILNNMYKSNCSIFNNIINQISSFIKTTQEILNMFNSYKENQNIRYTNL